MDAAPQPRRLRVVHVITTLGTGGAEVMLLKLVHQTAITSDNIVISLLELGDSIATQIEACGVPVHRLHLTGMLRSLTALPRLARLLKTLKPDIVQGWMYHGNIAASLATAWAWQDWPVTWSIRCTIDTFKEKLRTRFLLRASVLLSRKVQLIFYNSEPALEQHEALGYPRRGKVLPNGFDTRRFSPDPVARAASRAAFGIAADSFVIGYIGRLKPIKDLPTLFAALARVAARRPDTIFVVAGREMPLAPERLAAAKADIAALGSRLLLLPEVDDIASLYRNFDILTLTSSAEGFPNVLGEAMACGVPCVATDVGACREIIANTGSIVPVHEPAILADALLAMADMPHDERTALGERARARIVELYSIDSVAARYEAQWQRLAANLRATP